MPTNVAYIRSFMGMARYYHRFIKGLSKVAYPITSFQKKGKNFRWSKEFQQSFENLKQLLTTTPILKVEYLEKEFIVYTYAFQEGVRRV